MARPFTTHILKFKGQSYSNNGISARHDEVVVIPAGSEDHPDAAKPNAVRIVERTMGGRKLWHAEPINPFGDPSNRVGPMMGGTFIPLQGYTFNLPEFPGLDEFYGAIALHDRFETVAEYDSYSR